ncbi:hypothetical protein J4Q44_G00100200 [Coregonus suidteri]|uniref:Uncharacterized protein n=1 Tax=Coregonus suidteri TaxID=861788 RepID=A0AAN8LYR1_9TELE
MRSHRDAGRDPQGTQQNRYSIMVMFHLVSAMTDKTNTSALAETGEDMMRDEDSPPFSLFTLQLYPLSLSLSLSLALALSRSLNDFLS